MDQLAALESTVRQDILDVVAATGAVSIADVAEQLGRAPASLYFHIDKLVRVGLLLRAGERRVYRRLEALYATPARLMRLAVKPLTRERRRALRRIVLASVRATMRDLEYGLERPDVELTGPERDLYSSRLEGWLTAEQRRQVNRHIAEIESILAASPPRGGARRCAVFLSLAPRPVRKDAHRPASPGDI